MVTPSLDFSVYSDGTLKWQVAEPVIQPRYKGWRCLHVPEGGYQTPARMPEVRPSKNAEPIKMTDAMKELSYELMEYRNPNITRHLWKAVFNIGVAFCNHTPWQLEKAIICGGMFLRGIMSADGRSVVCWPGTHGIDVNKPLPTVEEVLANNWYFSAVTWSGERVNHFPQGQGAAVLVPYFLQQTVTYPLSWFEPWEGDSLPDPLKVYR